MAFDDALAERVRDCLLRVEAISEKRMFGGLCFLHDGNMCCGIVGDELMVRVGADGHAAALARPHAREMDFTGRPLKGMVYVGAGGLEDDADLRTWVMRGVDFARTLPPK